MVEEKQKYVTDVLSDGPNVLKNKKPYGVPENWIWTNGKSIFAPMTARRPTGQWFNYIDIDAIDNKNQTVRGAKLIEVSNAPSRASREVRKGDTLFSLVRPYLMNIAYIDEVLADCIASTGFFVCRPNKLVNERFIYLLMTSSYVVDGLNMRMKGDNSPSIKSSDILDFAFPLPPLTEQQRIVDRIESLFEKLDQAKGLIQDALDFFENRKAAILHKAFSGELTKKWREENGVGMESWDRCMLKDVCILPITDGTHQTPTYCTKEDGGVPFISAKDVTTGEINWEKIKHITPELHQELYKRVAPRRDDVLLAKNGTTGIAALVETDMVFDIYVTLALLRPKVEVIMPKYLLRVVNSPDTKKQFDEHLTGIGVPNLHLRDIRVITIYVPQIKEQNEIVSIIDDLIENEKQAKEFLKETNKKIDAMKKSILARAFRGELGTNDPSEESSIELLKKSILGTEKNEIKMKTKILRPEVSVVALSIIEVLKLHKRMTPEQLKRSTELEIDDFYEQIKKLINQGSIAEIRENDTVYLEVSNFED